jgi:predicted porin
MNTSSLRLSALAAAAFLSTAAMAQSSVTVYGAMGLDLIYATGVAKTGGGSGSVVKLDDNAIVSSRLGFKGSEDLGGGLSALFGLESSVRPDTGSAGGGGSTFWNRGSFVGLNSSVGSVKFGRQWNVSDDYMCGYIICGGYAAFQFNGFGSLSDLYDNAVKYTSPQVGGFEAAVIYGAGEQAGKTTAGQKFQALVNYGQGPLSAAVLATSEKSTAGQTNKLYALGAAYDFGPAKLRLAYATTDVSYSSAFKASMVDLGVDVPVSPKTVVSADYVSKNVSSGTEPEVRFVRVRGSYALSKRTSLNANVVRIDNGTGSTVGFAGATEAGKGQTILSAGITHSF